MVNLKPVDAPRRAPRATGVPDELSEILNEFRTRPGQWFEVGTTLEQGGTNSPKHRLRARYMKILRREGIGGYEFTVGDNGRTLFGRKVK